MDRLALRAGNVRMSLLARLKQMIATCRRRVLPFEDWKKISPTGDYGGLLCPTCMVRAAVRVGVRSEARFCSGPFQRTGNPSVYWQLVRLEGDTGVPL